MRKGHLIKFLKIKKKNLTQSRIYPKNGLAVHNILTFNHFPFKFCGIDRMTIKIKDSLVEVSQ